MSWSEVNFLDKKIKDLSTKVATIYSNVNSLTTKLNSIEQNIGKIRQYTTYEELPNLIFKTLDTGIKQKDTVSDVAFKTLLNVTGKGYLCYCYAPNNGYSHNGTSDYKLKITIDGVVKLWIELTEMKTGYSVDIFGIIPNSLTFNSTFYGDKKIGLVYKDASTSTNIQNILNYSSNKQVFRKAINRHSYIYKIETLGIRFEKSFKIEANVESYNILYSLD